MNMSNEQSTATTAYFPFITTIYRQDENEEPTPASNLEVSGTGALIATNTGGSSASEGGVGSDSGTETEKGELNKNEDSSTTEKDTFDPIKRNVEKAEKEGTGDE